jgi:phosphoserine aminotransferase
MIMKFSFFRVVQALQFAMVPFNLMKTDGKAAYLDTGTWARSY